MEQHLINSSICLFSLWLTYKLLLENTSWHRFKRFYLLGSVVASAIVPLIVVRTIVIPVQIYQTPVIPEFEYVETTVAETGFQIDWMMVLMAIYIIGTLIMATRLALNLRNLRVQPTDEITEYKNYQLVLRSLIEVPHSFLNKIYASRKNYHAGRIPEVVLDHEKAHLDQKHSLDILFIEALIVLMWFNPLVYLLKYSVKLNHEFLADQAVIAAGANTHQYQETLLAFTAGKQQRALANTFNFPIIKKRFTIMKTQTNHTAGLLRSLAIIPVLALLVISCGQEETVMETDVIEEEKSEELDEKFIVIEAKANEGVVYVKGVDYKYVRDDAKINFYDSVGNKIDFENQGYTLIEIEEIDEEIIYEQIDITAKEIKEYDNLAQKHTAELEEKGNSIFLGKETTRMQALWHNMNTQQKAKAEPWPYVGVGDTEAGEIAAPPVPKKNDTMLSGMPLSNGAKIIYAPVSMPAYDFNANFYNQSDLAKLRKQYGQNLIAITGYTNYEGNRYEYAEDYKGGTYFNENMEMVDLEKKARGKIIRKTILPPPPPPPMPSNASIIKGLNNGSMKLFIKGNPASTSEAARLPESYKNNEMYMKRKNGVLNIYFEGELNDKAATEKISPQITTDKDKQTASIQNGSWKDVKYFLQSGTESTSESQANEDYQKRMAFLNLADKQLKPVNYTIDGRKVNQAQVKQLIASNNSVPFSLVTEKGDQHELAFKTSNERISATELQKMYSRLFETVDLNKNRKQFVLVSSNATTRPQQDTLYTITDKATNEKMDVRFVRTEDPYSFYELNGDRGDGTFIHNGVKYKYNMPTDLSLELFDEDGKKLTSDQIKKLKLVLTPIWNSKSEEKVLKNDPVVRQYFENGNAVFFHRDGYTNDYAEMIAYDFGDTYIHKFLEHGKLRIDLIPYSWKKTNPTLIDFFKRDNI
ncbi:M56 family metallopeptidase [Nonlabens ponticola]|uniref:M56 family metallopeptidase n=1 Tax=Nonlabens ponticola TaxID=2496866 RepID=A0A3S9MUK3_9FLAO|nr:M56 family metallopeptidase [Nonlabens ponticola]AZQ42851.1 M56 family metallopeptidase [Nonlabens ponticola]